MAKRILIVDDEPFILSQMSKALQSYCDFHGGITTVENGSDAIHEISQYFYSICFLDINLPDINGLDVMKKTKEISPETRIIIMTASFITENMKKIIEENASLFIEKPFDLSQVKVFLNQVFGKKGVPCGK